MLRLSSKFFASPAVSQKLNGLDVLRIMMGELKETKNMAYREDMKFVRKVYDRLKPDSQRQLQNKAKVLESTVWNEIETAAPKATGKNTKA